MCLPSNMRCAPFPNCGYQLMGGTAVNIVGHTQVCAFPQTAPILQVLLIAMRGLLTNAHCKMSQATQTQ